MTDVIEERVTRPTENSEITLQTETSYKLNDHFQWLIVFADQKASFIISLSLWLLAWNIAIISYNLTILQSAIKKNDFSDWIMLALYIIFIISIIILQWLVFHKSVEVVVPVTKNESKKTSIFYYWEVAKSNHEDFRNKIICKKMSDILDDLIYQVYDKAFVADKKFELVSYATTLLKILVWLTILHPFIYLVINLING